MLKSIILLAALLGSIPAFAWDTLVSCDNGRFVVEKQCFSAPSQYGGGDCYSSRTQMVIRNRDVQNYFADMKAFGNYSHPGKFEGFSSARYPEMIVGIDNIQTWGVSGSYDYHLYIPYGDDSVAISYYVNYTGQNSVTVKAVANSKSVFNIVRAGTLGSWTYNDCYIR
jgi:hypothetical protein